jgi:hypothetical protein
LSGDVARRPADLDGQPQPHQVPGWPRARHAPPVGSRFHVDQRRVDGHIFMACEHCKPTTYFFGVVHSRPSPIVYCYAITEEQHQFWRNTTDDELAQPLEEDHETEDCSTASATTPAISGERCEEE